MHNCFLKIYFNQSKTAILCCFSQSQAIMHLMNSFYDNYEFHLFLISDYSLSARKSKRFQRIPQKEDTNDSAL